MYNWFVMFISSWRVVKLSGNANNSANTGAFYLNANNTSSNVNRNIRVQLALNSMLEHHTQYVTIQFKLDDTNFILFTGSMVLINQLEKYKDNLPFHTTIKKIDKYYTFT